MSYMNEWSPGSEPTECKEGGEKLLYDMPYENSFASKWLGYNVRNIHFEYRK